jgi:hypothetical protein
VFNQIKTNVCFLFLLFRESALINELQVAYSKVTLPLHQMKGFLEEQHMRFDGLIKGRIDSCGCLHIPDRVKQN